MAYAITMFTHQFRIRKKVLRIGKKVHMTTQVIHEGEQELAASRKLKRLVGGGTTAEALAGAAAATIAVFGLAGVRPFYMTAIGTIACGAASFIEGAAVTSAYAKLVEDDRNRGLDEQTIVVGGFSIETLAGATGIVLGIIALAGIQPMVLLPIASIVLGGALILGGAARVELSLSVLEVHGAGARARRMATQTLRGLSGFSALAGIAAVVLGILALVGQGPTPLSLPLIAVLVLGAANLVGGSATLGTLAVGNSR